MIQDRWYQTECADAVWNDLRGNKDVHPVAAIPTGGGKSVILCLIADHILENSPSSNVLVLSHVAKILQQNHEKLEWYFEGCPIGLYSAELGERKISKITVAGIHSVYRKPELFKQFDYVIIDEAHLINNKDQGMYRSFLSKLDANYIGLTATPYRTKGGLIYQGENTLFNKLSYDLTSLDNFNRLVEEGYLSLLVPRATTNELDTAGIRTKAGDFHEGDMSKKFDREEITSAIVQEIIKAGKRYKRWMLFAIDIAHCEHIAAELNKNNIPARAVHSATGEATDKVIEDYKAGKYRALVSVNKLTTGIDVPDIDLIAMLRPTKSPVIHVQALGRGLRVAEGKTHCLVLDFAGNTARLGPINDIKMEDNGKKKGVGGGEMAKECKECGALNHLAAKECIDCGYEFPIKEKLDTNASNLQLIKSHKDEKLEQWVDVSEVKYSIHNKKGAPSSLRVTYKIGLQSFSEWVCIDHKGYARAKAMAWLKNRWVGDRFDIPDNLPMLYKNTDQLRTPSRILVNLDNKFPEIKDVQF